MKVPVLKNTWYIIVKTENEEKIQRLRDVVNLFYAYTSCCCCCSRFSIKLNIICVLIIAGCRETAFIYAITSAGVTHSIGNS